MPLNIISNQLPLV
jgi:quercetin dioxygenase-like cupin family protein